MLLLKDRKQNVLMTYAEWATLDSGTVKTLDERGGRLRIFSLDGRLRYTSDSSLGFGERESHHPVAGRIDIDESAALDSSMVYWFRFFSRLEQDLGVRLS